jgi:hypothetical protein
MNIELVFYKGSFGLKLGKYIYRFRRNCSTMQKLRFTADDSCVIIDTGYPASMITDNDIKILLNRKARQPATLWLRYNCLRSHRHILNKLEGYELNGVIMPSKYRKRIR